jgi:3-deoxy-D-manno-octulosonate 8-phosphate phosphatase (KDO 8-P phosphatase)
MSNARSIHLLVLDVDGVLTDAGIIYSEDGVEHKRFCARDGAGIMAWRRLGNRVAILSGRTSSTVERRARELGIDLVVQGSKDKLADLRSIVKRSGCTLDETAMMGDDWPDLPAMMACHYRITVGDACQDVRNIADFVARHRGGHGAVREAIEHLLQEQGRLAEAQSCFVA